MKEVHKNEEEQVKRAGGARCALACAGISVSGAFRLSARQSVGSQRSASPACSIGSCGRPSQRRAEGLLAAPLLLRLRALQSSALQNVMKRRREV